QLTLAAGVRSIVIVVLAVALMRPVVYWTTESVSVVYLLDVSQSIAPPAIQDALQWIRHAEEGHHGEASKFIAFGANSHRVENAADLGRVKLSRQGDGDAVDPTGSDLAAALDNAMRSFAPHSLKRLVLLSDGNENAGTVGLAVEHLKSEGVHV